MPYGSKKVFFRRRHAFFRTALKYYDGEHQYLALSFGDKIVLLRNDFSWKSALFIKIQTLNSGAHQESEGRGKYEQFKQFKTCGSDCCTSTDTGAASKDVFEQRVYG